ncbi:hypothetical protein BHUM_05307c [Candidatus Burkholderia humilis]|nr:hypothetical protein BHUM_05307c [Candidatus Burkholderia humilis]
MKKIISTYWPVAIFLLNALTFCMHIERDQAAERRAQTSVAGVSAELARAISLGLIDDDDTAGAVVSKKKMF